MIVIVGCPVSGLVFKTLKIFLSETTRPRAVIFWYVESTYGPLPNCSNYGTWSKRSCPEDYMFDIGLLAHLSRWLMVSYNDCDCWMSGVRPCRPSLSYVVNNRFKGHLLLNF